MGVALAERPYPTDFSAELTLLDDYRDVLDDLHPGGNAARRALDTLYDRGFEVVVGVGEDDVKSITAVAEQEAIRTMCPKDVGTRFGDADMMRGWFKKGKGEGRGMFLLRSLADASLAGYGWTGPETCKELPNQTHTFAVRLGEQTRGQRLATPFTRAIVMGSMAVFGARNIGLETWGRNTPAVRSYLAANARLITTHYDEKERDTRLFMHFQDTFVPERFQAL